MKRLLEGVELAPLGEMTLHVGNVRRVARVALKLVEHPQQNGENRVSSRSVVGLGFDIEQDDIGGKCDGPPDIGVEKRIAYFGLKKISRPLGLAIVAKLAIPHEVGEHFEKMGFSRAEETGNPHTHFVCDLGLVEVIGHLQIAAEKTVEVLVELAGDNKLVQLLPNGGVILLVCFNDAIDGAFNVTVKKFTKGHHSQGTSLKAR